MALPLERTRLLIGRALFLRRRSLEGPANSELEQWIETETEAAAADGSTAGRGRCTTSFAQTAANRPRCPSSPTVRGRSTAWTASGREPPDGPRRAAPGSDEPLSVAPPTCGRGLFSFLDAERSFGLGRCRPTAPNGPHSRTGIPPVRSERKPFPDTHSYGAAGTEAHSPGGRRAEADPQEVLVHDDRWRTTHVGGNGRHPLSLMRSADAARCVLCPLRREAPDVAEIRKPNVSARWHGWSALRVQIPPGPLLYGVGVSSHPGRFSEERVLKERFPDETNFAFRRRPAESIRGRRPQALTVPISSLAGHR